MKFLQLLGSVYILDFVYISSCDDKDMNVGGERGREGQGGGKERANTKHNNEEFQNRFMKILNIILVCSLFRRLHTIWVNFVT